MKEIGQLLKDKRLALNVSLEEVSIATKINVKILQALEDGDLDRLPAKTFVRGFVQTYSKYLGLNTSEVLSKLQEIVGTTKPQIAISQADTAPSGPIDTEVDFLSKSKSVITIVGIVITIIVIVVIQNIISKREADLDTTEVAAITGSDTPVTITQTTPSPTPALKDKEEDKEKGNVEDLAAEKPAASPTPQQAQIAPKPVQTPAPMASATPKPSPSPEAKPVAVVTPTPAAAAQTTLALSPQEVIVEALDNIILTISIDGKPSQDVSMMADQIQTFKASSKIRITTSNSGALSIIHNGKELGVPGNLGQPKTISFPQ
ncbi:MAG: helix-turn-helix domain-containing protein [Oligoflexia bacterium]|nr:helix-turn-helix domain-containing protein [Oligoflexia bacterium]